MKKDILVIGGGAREHAICDALRRSEQVGRIYAAPGNDGMEGVTATKIAASDTNAIVDFAKRNDIYMTVVVPDNPLSAGLVDTLTARGLRAFGPTKSAAKLESSKAYAKEFMTKYKIPTAQYQIFTDHALAVEYINANKPPFVIKADGLALGKGVAICKNRKEAEETLHHMMVSNGFNGAGKKVVIEQFLTGYEVSLMLFTDGKNYSVMPVSTDYKRAEDNDKGLNTGGMGAFCPVPQFNRLIEKTVNTIVQPTIDGLNAEGSPFKGVLYIGLMATVTGVYVVEYNARFGDPETQVVIPALKTDLLQVFDACINGNLDTLSLEWDSLKRVCVVAVSKGYPAEYQTGHPITVGKMPINTAIYQAGVKNGATSGGRVLSVVGTASTYSEARQAAYDGIAKIKFTGKTTRTDICKHALELDNLN